MGVEVSVIVPVYNAEQFLDDLIRYMENQTFRDFELICVDDGSTDSSLELLRQAEKKNDWIHVLTQQNQYAGVARNKGMEIAQGKYLVFLDADDIFNDNMLEELYRAAEKCEADIAVCGARAYYMHGDYYQYPNSYLNVNWTPDQDCFSAEDNADHIFDFTNVAAWNKMFRREFILENQIEFMSTKRSNDAFFVVKSLSCARRITVVPKCLMTYRKDNVNSLQGSNRCQDFEFYTVVKQFYTDLKDRGVKSKFFRSFANKALSICLYNLEQVTDREFYGEAFRKEVDAFYEFGLSDHGRGYYYNKGNFERMLALLEQDVNESWDELVRRKNRTTDVMALRDYQTSIQLQDMEDDKSCKVSVLVWVNNSAPFLAECLDSIRSQSLTDIEVICVDDGSTDDSAKILDAYAEEDGRFCIIHEEKSGKATSLNHALQKARGKYVYAVESTDFLVERALEIFYAEAQSKNLSVLSVNAETVFTPEDIRYVRNGRNPNYIRKKNYSEVRTGRELFVDMFTAKDDRYHTGLCFYNRDFLNNNGLKYTEGLNRCEEIFQVNALAFAERACHENVILLKHRVTAEEVEYFRDLLLQSKHEVWASKLMMDFYFSQQLYSDSLFGNVYLDHCAKIYGNALRRVRNTKDEAVSMEFENYVAGLGFQMRYLLERFLSEAELKMVPQNLKIKTFQNNKLKQDILKQKEKLDQQKEKLNASKQEIAELKKKVNDLSDKITLSRILKKIYRNVKK